MNHHKSNTNTNNNDDFETDIKYNDSKITCHLCLKDIEYESQVFCIRCDIQLCNPCNDKDGKDRNYCLCPNCKEIGTLGFIRKHDK